MMIYDLLTSIQLTLRDILTTGNVFLDTILSFIIFSSISSLSLSKFRFENLYNRFINLYNGNNYCEIIIEGKQIDFLSRYSEKATSSGVYSDSYRAIFSYITNNIFEKDDIKYIKETYYSQTQSRYDSEYNHSKEIYIVNNSKPFFIDEDIYCVVDKDNDYVEGGGDEKERVKMEKIIIKIFSYKLKISDLHKFVERIKTNYLNTIKEKRCFNKYIYTLEKTTYESSINECWSDCVFKSNRNFENTFFENKNEILEQIDFFLNNQEWYDKKGIPYNMGICLHGLPGTGKTSFVKALANYTGRHIIQLSLKLIQTKQELDSFFYEKIYTCDNKEECDFKDKIILLEDVDCANDIIFQRKSLIEENNNDSSKNNNININSCTINKEGSSVSTSELIEKMKLESTSKNKITLDDILNLFDGVKETSGRIIMMTTNYYDKLDTAFTRPGRFDMTIELKKANKEIIMEMFKMFFDKKIPKKYIDYIREYELSPAEIVNIYLTCGKKEAVFIDKIIKKNDI